MSLPKFNNKFLDSINLKFLKDLVLRFSPKYQIPNTKYLSHNSQGFALLPLIVLLLIGIAAGTYLIQNRTNFLPKAQQVPDFFNCLPEDVDKTDATQRKVTISHCEQVKNSDGKAYDTLTVTDESSKKGCIDLMNNAALPGYKNKMYCYWKPSQPAPAAQQSSVKSCTFTDITGGATFSHCDYKDQKGVDDPAKCAAIFAQNSTTAKPVPEGFALYCKQASTTQAAAAGGATETKEQCPQTDIDKCKTEYPKSTGCYMIDSKKRCIFPNENVDYCLQKDTDFCKTPPDPRDGCETKDITIIKSDSSKEQRKYTRCTPAKTGSAPAAPAAGTSSTGAPARTSSTANSQATSGAPSTGSSSQGSTLTSSGKPGITTEKCTSSQISNTGCSATPDRCVVDFARNGWCKYPDSEEGKACNSKHKGDCGSAECRVVNGLPRCQSTTCTEKDNTACGTSSACATASEKGFSYTYCGPKDGTSSSGGSTVRSGMTNADCGYTDKDGLPIPCFKVGVFTSSDELQATKANASLASARYSQSQEILAAVKGKIDDQVFAKAQERLAAAKAAADACMKQ